MQNQSGDNRQSDLDSIRRRIQQQDQNFQVNQDDQASQAGQVQSQSQKTSFSPESEPIYTGSNESVPIVEVREQEISPEVQEYVEKVDKENLELDRPVVHQGQPIVQPPQMVEQVEVVLPLTHQGMVAGLKEKVTSSARWLAEWCMRIIKKFKTGVFYSPDKN